MTACCWQVHKVHKLHSNCYRVLFCLVLSNTLTNKQKKKPRHKKDSDKKTQGQLRLANRNSPKSFFFYFFFFTGTNKLSFFNCKTDIVLLFDVFYLIDEVNGQREGRVYVQRLDGFLFEK